MTTKTIYFAGGCFWGLQKYFDAIQGVLATEAGYANGNRDGVRYEEVCSQATGHAEAVRVEYNPAAIPLPFLLQLFFQAIDPTAVNRQGGDTGPQYRTGVYYTNPQDAPVIRAALDALQQTLEKPVAVECQPLQNYTPAEEYHQRYLEKRPGGYCHLGPVQFRQAANARVVINPDGPPGALKLVYQPTGTVDPKAYQKPDAQTLQQQLTPTQYAVTQQSATEPPFENDFWDNHRKGIYVDITTGEPLFASAHKFDSGCGWPSFTKPIDPAALRQLTDESHGMHRVEVRSRVGNAHLGHVFPDGPPADGGLRYCINSAALRFVPMEEMVAQGYEQLLQLVE